MLTVMLAVPLERVPVPSKVGPLLNVTVSPSGMLPAVEVTVAVKVTACPTVEGFKLEDKLVVVPENSPYTTRLFWVPTNTFPSAAIGVAK